MILTTKFQKKITHHAATPNHALRGKFEPNQASQFGCHHASRKTPLLPCGNGSVISKRGYSPIQIPREFIVHLEFSMFVQQKIPTLGQADSYEIPTMCPKIYENMSANDPWKRPKIRIQVAGMNGRQCCLHKWDSTECLITMNEE